MKKYLVIALAAMFVLGFAASSFAIHAEIPSETQAVVAKSATQITIGGGIRVRGDYRADTSDFNKHTNTAGDRAYYDERVRLQIEAKVTPNTTGLIQLETTGNSANNADNYTWGSPTDHNLGTAVASEGARGSVLVGNTKANPMSILQAWILHQGTGLLGVPALVKVGHMPITIGTGLFYDHSYQGDDALLLGVDPVKNLHIILGTVKAYQQTTPLGTNNDVTGYALLVNYDVNKDTSLGLDITYVDDQNNGLTATSNIFLPFPDGFIGATTADIHLWNIGLNAKTKIAGKVGLYGEIDLQRGNVLDTSSLTATTNTANRDQKFRGYAAKAGATFSLAPAPVTLGVEAAIGSGDSNRNDGKIRGFITSQGATQHFSYVYDYRTANAQGNVQGGLQNTWYLKGSAAADITKDLSANLDVYYLRAVNMVDSGAATGMSTGVYTTANQSRNIGVEVDSKINYKIDRNLNYFVEGGYLFAGKFWKGANTTANAAVYRDHNPDDAYVVRHGIELSF